MTEVYKIFSWKEGNYWNINELMPVSEIRKMLSSLRWEKEVFASIQNYDEFSNCISSPLYFDFDGKPEQVMKDVAHFIGGCDFLLNIVPRIYFSGNRGFHLIIDHQIKHPRCHELIKDFAEQCAAVQTLDMSVYRTYAMFRIPGSLGSTKKFYKIQLSYSEFKSMSFEEIQELARKQRFIDVDHNIEQLDLVALDEWLKVSISQLPTYKSLESLKELSKDVGMEMTPCLSDMIQNGSEEGSRHSTAFLLARFLKHCNLDYQTSIDLLLNNKAWVDYNKDGSVEKIFRSTFKSPKPPKIGCRGNGDSAALMRDRCDNTCHFAKDFKEPKVKELKSNFGKKIKRSTREKTKTKPTF